MKNVTLTVFGVTKLDLEKVNQYIINKCIPVNTNYYRKNNLIHFTQW